MTDGLKSNSPVVSTSAQDRGAIASLPPVTEVGVGALVLVVIGGIYLSSYYPAKVSLLLPAILAIVAGLMVIFNIIGLAKSKALARAIFFKVGKWALLAYVIVAGMLEYVFVLDGTKGNALLLLTLMLVIFAVDVPTIIAFTVARYHDTSEEKADSGPFS
ncbi:MAG: hypothetical protein EPN30_04650 [Actinomycetota bacterium]|nr:MAG: hypothetical protein EPN30_04650 [Actinomycetota bacterium]